MPRLLLLLCMMGLGLHSTAAQQTLEFQNGFESGAFITSPARSSEWGIITSCSGATSSVKAAAARTGSFGAMLSVKAVCANWRLKLQTRNVLLSTTKSYALCLWARSNYTAKPFLPTTALSFYKQDGTTATLINAVQPRITSQWAQYCHYVHRVPVDGAVYNWNLNVGAAAANTAFFIDDVTLTSEPNAAFNNYVATAPARIEQHRKGDFSLDLRYSDGSQVPAAAVQGLAVTMKKHDFVFGVAYSPENFATSQAAQLAWYKSKAATLFNGLVAENAFKWPYFEPTNNSRTAGLALLNQFYNFTAAADHQFMRQHTMEWFLPDTEFTGHWSRKSGCAAYAAALKTRIEREVALFPGVVKSLDIFNELMQRRAYAETCNLFAGGPNSVIVQAFKWANAVRPNLRLCLNDYDLVSDDRFINYVEMVQWLVANGAPVHCIGVQSHLGPADILPDTMAFRLEKLSALLNLTIEVTEVSFHTAEDPVTWAQTMTDEAAQADAFSKMLTTYFSHPRVNAVLLWGFADTNHFIPSGGIYRSDGTPKPAGTVVETLLTKTWNTSSPAVTFTASPAQGLPTFRGFYGRYDVAATVATGAPGQSTTTIVQRVNLAAAGGPAQTAVLTLPLAPPAGAAPAASLVPEEDPAAVAAVAAVPVEEEQEPTVAAAAVAGDDAPAAAALPDASVGARKLLLQRVRVSKL